MLNELYSDKTNKKNIYFLYIFIFSVTLESKKLNGRGKTCVVHSQKWPLLEMNERYTKNTVIGLVFGDEFLAQGLHLKSHQRCSAGIKTCLSADQSSSSTLTESISLWSFEQL